MNIIEQTEALKDLPDQRLMQEMQAPTGFAPQFLVLSELKRRKRMRDEYQRQQAANMKTVAEEAVTAAGVPQEGIMQMSQAMNPNSSIAQNTGADQRPQMQPTQAPQMMADGGVVKMQPGGRMLNDLFEYNRRNSNYIGNRGRGNALNAYFRNELDPSRQEYREMSGIINDIGIDAARELSSQVVNPGGLPMRDYDYRRTFFADPSMSQQESMRNRQMIAGTLPSYKKGTGRATMIDGMFVELMPDGSVYDIRSGDLITGEIAQKTINKLNPDLTEDNASYTDFIETPSIYRPEVGMPTQEDLDLKADELPQPQVFPNDISVFDMDKIYNEEQDSRQAEALRMMDINKIPTDSPTFMGDVVPYLAGVSGDLLSATARGTGIIRDAENDLNNPMVSTISSALEGQTGTEQMADFLEQEYFRMMTPADRLANLGFKPITNVEGNQRFVNQAGRVVELQGEKAVELSGGDAMETIGIAQRQGQDFSKSPLDFSVLPRFGFHDLDESGNVIPNTYDPIIKSMDISDIRTPEFIQNIFNPSGDELLSPESASKEQIETVKALQDYKLQVDDESGDLLPAPLPEGSTALSFGELLKSSTDGDDTSTNPAGNKVTGGQKASATSSLGGIEGRIAKMLEEKEKSAQSDKWMALAQAGMALMASDAPTLGGAIGEAGLVGLGALKKGKEQYDKDVLDLLTLQQRIDAQKARSSGRGGLTASNMISLMDDLRRYKGDIQDRIDALNSPANMMDPAEKERQIKGLQQELFRTDIELGTYRNALRGTGSIGSQSFDVRGGSAQQPSVGYSLGTASQ